MLTWCSGVGQFLLGLFLFDFTGRETPGQVRWVGPSMQCCQGNPKGWLPPIAPHSARVH